MTQLTKAEEQVMQYLWSLEEGLVQDVRECFEDPKPSRTTVSTMLRILETKGFVAHKGEGRVFTYYPLIRKEDYSKHQLFGVLKNYFNGSFSSMASFFARESNLTVQEVDELLKQTKDEFRKENDD